MDEASRRFAARHFLIDGQRTLNKKRNYQNRSLICGSTYVRSSLIS